MPAKQGFGGSKRYRFDLAEALDIAVGVCKGRASEHVAWDVALGTERAGYYRFEISVLLMLVYVDYRERMSKLVNERTPRWACLP